MKFVKKKNKDFVTRLFIFTIYDHLVRSQFTRLSAIDYLKTIESDEYDYEFDQ